ncbi:MAG: sulfatase-like hydrolase/transferase [Ferruginibacter sp.]
MFVERIPRLLRWTFSVILLLLLTMTIFRFIFYWTYNPPGRAFSGSAFILGFRYDARVACVIGLSILILCAFPFLNPIKNIRAKTFWNILLPLVFLILLIFYAADYYHYDYLHTRLNASVLNYLQDAKISGKMMGESYPVVKIVLIILALLLLSAFVFSRLLKRYQTMDTFNKRRSIGIYIISVFVMAQLVVGRFVFKPGQFPLRWSDAFANNDDYKGNLALNPIQSFLSTLTFKDSQPDIPKTKAAYAMMAEYLNVNHPDSMALNYERQFSFPDSINKKTNVVLIICESFSAYKSSMWGNPLNTTPYFNELCKNGVFFDRCFTPAYGTARGVWAAITGIPDVEAANSASRNSANVDQHSIINDFKGYEKFYFLGGSTSWANIRGLLTNNITGLHLYEENDYKEKAIDVWGISDKNLFKEANGILKEQTKPFFAVIQTADNHRPYTITKEDQEDFQKLSFPQDSLIKYGFQSNDEMNAFRFTDFCYQHFIEAAKKEKYFDNTLFIFVGDHGIRGDAGNMLPKAYTQQALVCEHVPLLFYAPKLLKPYRISDVCSQVDILPSAAAITGTPYHNTALGRNVFEKPPGTMYKSYNLENEKAFIIDHDEKTIGVVSNNYYFRKNMKSGVQQFVSMTDSNPVPANHYTDSVRDRLNKLTDAYYETSKYLLQNNKKTVVHGP